MSTTKTNSYAAKTAGAPLEPFVIERRAPQAFDVQLEVLHCGVCHSDLHAARNDWGMSSFPVVPGHEIVGIVTAVGPSVTRFKVGDSAAVGCLVNSCGDCSACARDLEQYCPKPVFTYGASDPADGTVTYGGYSKHLVTVEKFVLNVPKGLDLARAAPLLCAGITMYSPLVHWKVKAGTRVGIVGMGGLGHMGIKLAVGMGADVTLISRSASKEKDAKELGAQHFLLSSDADAMAKAAESLDVILDTIPVKHDVNPYANLLTLDGSVVIVGQVGPINEVMTQPLIFRRRTIAGSLIGGIAETQEMLNFCAEKNILPEVESIRLDQINEAYERMEKSDVRYRFVIDMSSVE